MGTPAAVYIEDLDKTVRVNYDGYMDHMLPALTRIIEKGLLEAFADGVEYSSIFADDEYAAKELVSKYNEGRPVNDVGVGYPDGNRIELTAVKNEDGTYTFSQNENHHYLIKGGKITHLTPTDFMSDVFFVAS